MLASVKLSKTHISKIVQLGGFLGNLAFGLTEAAFRAGIETDEKGEPILAKNAIKCLNKKINELKKTFTITLRFKINTNKQ